LLCHYPHAEGKYYKKKKKKKIVFSIGDVKKIALAFFFNLCKKNCISILSSFLIFFFFLSEDSGVILLHRIKRVIGNKMYKNVKQLKMHQVLCFGAPS
jgi:hypothetical protein